MSDRFVVESGKVEQVALDIQRVSLLKDLRTKFAVAEAGANLYLGADCCDRPNDFSALVRRDAVSAAQGRVRPEHAQNSFHVWETVSGVFEQSPGTRNQPPA